MIAVDASDNSLGDFPYEFSGQFVRHPNLQIFNQQKYTRLLLNPLKHFVAVSLLMATKGPQTGITVKTPDALAAIARTRFSARSSCCLESNQNGPSWI